MLRVTGVNVFFSLEVFRLVHIPVHLLDRAHGNDARTGGSQNMHYRTNLAYKQRDPEGQRARPRGD